MSISCRAARPGRQTRKAKTELLAPRAGRAAMGRVRTPTVETEAAALEERVAPAHRPRPVARNTTQRPRAESEPRVASEAREGRERARAAEARAARVAPAGVPATRGQRGGLVQPPTPRRSKEASRAMAAPEATTSQAVPAEPAGLPAILRDMVATGTGTDPTARRTVWSRTGRPVAREAPDPSTDRVIAERAPRLDQDPRDLERVRGRCGIGVPSWGHLNDAGASASRWRS